MAGELEPVILSLLQKGSVLHTGGSGYFLVPAGPGQGTSPANSGASWTYGAWTTMTAGAVSAFFVTGMTFMDPGSSVTRSEFQLQFGTGTVGNETPIGDTKGFFTSASSLAGMFAFPYPIPVPANTRLAVRLATTTGTVTMALTLQCLLQANLTAG